MNRDGADRDPGAGAWVAGTADVERIAATLADAFHADPVWGWAFADAERRRGQHEAWFRLLLSSATAYGWVWVTQGYGAAAVWIPPGRPELSAADERALEPLIEEHTGTRAPVILEAFRRFDAAHPRDRDHYYLSLLGTQSSHRGAGLGMGLLAANLAEIDRAGMPAYLESTNPANVPRYRSVGFEVCGSFDLPAGGPTVTTMWREPRR